MADFDTNQRAINRELGLDEGRYLLSNVNEVTGVVSLEDSQGEFSSPALKPDTAGLLMKPDEFKRAINVLAHYDHIRNNGPKPRITLNNDEKVLLAKLLKDTADNVKSFRNQTRHYINALTAGPKASFKPAGGLINASTTEGQRERILDITHGPQNVDNVRTSSSLGNNKNYRAITLTFAGLPIAPEPSNAPSPDEKKKMQDQGAFAANMKRLHALGLESAPKPTWAS